MVSALKYAVPSAFASFTMTSARSMKRDAAPENAKPIKNATRAPWMSERGLLVDRPVHPSIGSVNRPKSQSREWQQLRQLDQLRPAAQSSWPPRKNASKANIASLDLPQQLRRLGEVQAIRRALVAKTLCVAAPIVP